MRITSVTAAQENEVAAPMFPGRYVASCREGGTLLLSPYSEGSGLVARFPMAPALPLAARAEAGGSADGGGGVGCSAIGHEKGDAWRVAVIATRRQQSIWKWIRCHWI